MIVRKNESNRPLSRTGKALAASLLIAFFTASGSAVAQADLPSLGDGLELSVGDERRIGDDIIRQLYRDPDYLDDGPLQEYVQATLDALRQAARTRGELPEELDERFAWTVLLGRDRSVNAFALPGGYLGVHLGLVGVVSSRDELASVLAHELSHVSQRHIARLFAQQQRMTPLMIGTMLLGALAASKSPHAAEALMVGGQAAAIQSQLNFSRDMEREADRLGFALMALLTLTSTLVGWYNLRFISQVEKDNTQALIPTMNMARQLSEASAWELFAAQNLTSADNEKMWQAQGRMLTAQSLKINALLQALREQGFDTTAIEQQEQEISRSLRQQGELVGQRLQLRWPKRRASLPLRMQTR